MKAVIADSQYWTLVITMIVGGLIYSILSLSYLHATFSTKDDIAGVQDRQTRSELRIEQRLNNIETKLDRLIEQRAR